VVGKAKQVGRLVACKDYGGSLRSEAAKELADSVCVGGGDAAEWLIGNQALRRAHKCRGDLSAAEFSARKVGRTTVEHVRHAAPVCTLMDITTIELLLKELELPPHRHSRREQIVVWQPEEALPCELRQRHPKTGRASEEHDSCRRLHKTCGNSQERRLSRAIPANEHAHFTEAGAQRR